AFFALAGRPATDADGDHLGYGRAEFRYARGPDADPRGGSHFRAGVVDHDVFLYRFGYRHHLDSYHHPDGPTEFFPLRHAGHHDHDGARHTSGGANDFRSGNGYPGAQSRQYRWGTAAIYLCYTAGDVAFKPHDARADARP